MPWQWFRRSVLPALDPVARRVGQYTAYQLSDAELVGSVATRRATVRRRLLEAGYTPARKAAAKRHPDDRDRIDAGSLRRVPADHPDVSAPLTREWRPVDCQYHVHLFPGPDGDVEVYSHYEVRPDFLVPEPDVERLRIHYRPEWGEQYLRGVAGPAVRAAVT